MLMDSSITRLKARGPSRTFNESQEEGEEEVCRHRKNGICPSLILIAFAGGLIAGVVEAAGPRAACDVGYESTVLDCSVDPPALLRPGKVSKEQIEAVLGYSLSGEVAAAGDAPKAPGECPKRGFKLLWREAGPLHHLDDQVDSDQ